MFRLNSRILSDRRKVDKTGSRIGRNEPDFYLFADLKSALALLDAAIDRRPQDAGECSASGDAGYDRFELLANVPLHYGRGDDLPHLSLNLAGSFFLLVTVFGYSFEFLVRIWLRLV